MESSDVSKYGRVDPNLKLCRPQLLTSVYLKVFLKLVGPTALVSKPSTNHLNVATELHLRATELEATVQGGDVICIL